MTAPATPVTPAAPAPAPLGTDRRGTPSRRRAWLAVAVLLAAAVFVLSKGLGEATIYFRTADEAVAQRESLGTKRFRLEGTVVDGSVRPTRDSVAFDVTEGGATVHVVHRGDPPELFQPGIPVVLEGRFRGESFASDRIMVKHSEEYRRENPDRVRKEP